MELQEKVKVFGWLVNGGDGSISVEWVREQDQPLWEAYAEGEGYNDGDGPTDRIQLTFDSYEQAEACGIVFAEKPE